MSARPREPGGARRTGRSASGTPHPNIESRSAPCHELLGRKLVRADIDSGAAEMEFEGRPEFENGMGRIQGGFVAAMLDSVMGGALRTVLADDEAPPTLELKVSFVRGAEAGRLVGTARVVHKGRSVAFVEGELRTPDGELLATSSATAHLVRLPPTPAG